ncbi:ABC transporter substrate-binding protein [Propionibacterium australiense]|uniref:ABC transporter substrate-binding protein n=1 Tax=Propionibacterium australiense TaxID=119981 RepID=A0A383S8Y3_9ACTN|nr:ABC transporter substrate-binding protein [Propionibacterium australiense]RLP06499.1 ABC transporter substrate-binding protein [Propionibacterium australiense]RLP06567.1 ABC transporter substrate-binding protein [Propionibacterium australiense]SYZ34377.1 Solute-binding protein family 5 domain [Propionibacterium australiense]VEH92062.1 Hemin-binding lipoprotein [Propionibacterium australiense]
MHRIILTRRGLLTASAAGAAVAGLGMAGCSSGSGSGGSSTELKFGCTNFSKESLDPSNQTNAAWACMRYGVGESLFKFDEHMVAQPNLSDSFTVDEEHTNWQFHIREGLMFSTGTEVTATKVAESLQRMYDKEGVEGSSSPSNFMKPDSITADDAARTVTIVTKVPYADLPAALANPLFEVLDIAGSENIDEKPIGTGPYAVSEFNSGQNVRLTRNEHYWNGEVPFESVDVIFIDDASSLTKSLALQSGDVDVTENITAAADLETLGNDPDYSVSQTISMRTGFSYLNAAEGRPLANKALRTAICMAIDETTITETTVGGLYTAGHSVVPSSLDFGYEQLTDATPYDKERAKKILDEAGVVDSDGDGFRELDGKKIDLAYVTYDSRNLSVMAEAVSTQLAEIGIQATVENVDADTEWDRLVAGDYDMNSSNWMTTQEGDPFSYLANWYSKSDANYCGYRNDEYDALYEQLETELDTAERKKIFVRLQQILIDDAAVLVHGYYNSNMCSNAKTVTGATVATADYYWITSAIKPAQ